MGCPRTDKHDPHTYEIVLGMLGHGGGVIDVRCNGNHAIYGSKDST